MDDLQLIEAVEAVREHLRTDVPDLHGHLARLTMADYRLATPGELQECLARVALGLEERKPGDALNILRKIARAEASAPAGGASGIERAPSWVIQENVALDLPDEDQEILFSQAIRYLSLPPVDEDDLIEDNDETSDGHGGSVAEKISESRRGKAEPAPPIPSRLGRELARCISIRQAVACIRRRLPNLKGLTVYRFLAAIGYPVAVPSVDAMRFCRYIGLLDEGEKAAAAEKYLALCERASRVTGVPVAQVGHLLAIYSGGHKLDGHTPVCGKRPRCQVCSLAGRCSHYPTVAAAAAEATALSGTGKASPDRGLKIKDWAMDERPRERLLAGERLSNSELLAIILRTGSGRLSAVDLGRELMKEFQTLHDLEKASPQDIVGRMRGKGIGEAKAAEICAALELGRRVAQPAADTRLGLRQVGSSREVFELCRPRYKAATQEEFLLLILNTKNRVQKEVSVSIGTLNSSIVHPRDVFRHALREAAAAVIFVHNHPSGDPAPSDEDILLTARLVDVGKLLGIQVLDHVIIGSHEFYSFADHRRLK